MSTERGHVSMRIEGCAAVIRCRRGEPLLLEMVKGNQRCIPVGCRGGGCGVCRIRVLSGRYGTGRMSRARVTAEEENEGYALACKVLPVTDLSIMVIGLPVAGPPTPGA